MVNKKTKKRGRLTSGQADKFETLDIETEVFVSALLHNTRTRRLLQPYLVTLDAENQTAFLKILATLLFFEEEHMDKIAEETLGEEAPFVKMYARALAEIIDEDVAVLMQYGCGLGHS